MPTARTEQTSLSESSSPAASEAPQVNTVLYISGTGDLVGGGQVSLHQLVTHLDPSRYSAIVLAQAEGTLTKLLREADIEVAIEPGLGARYLRGNYRQVLRSSARVAHLLRHRRIALVHNNSWVPGDRVIGIGATRLLARRPYVHHERDTWTPNSKADRLTARFATRIVSISDCVSEKYNVLGASNKMVKIFNGVDLSRFAPRSSSPQTPLREKLDLGPQVPLIGIFSRIGKEKGHPLLIEAAALVQQTSPESHFIVVGDTVNSEDGYAKSLRKLASERGVAERFHFLGFRHDVPELMRECTLTVCPSTHTEPFGRVIIESMACEVPVIAAALGGPTEIIEHGRTGLLVEPGNADAWANAITELLRSPSRTAGMGLEGRQVVRSRFSISKHASEIQDLYDDLLPGY